MSDVQFLQAGHQYVSSLESPKLHFRDGGSYTMNVKNGHKLLRLQPISSTAANSMNYRTITAQLSTPYDPPTYINRPEKLTITEMLQAATTRRPNAETPTAFTWHLRMGYAGVKVLKHTHANVISITRTVLPNKNKSLRLRRLASAVSTSTIQNGPRVHVLRDSKIVPSLVGRETPESKCS